MSHKKIMGNEFDSREPPEKGWRFEWAHGLYMETRGVLMCVLLDNFKRMVAALSLGLAIVLIQVPSAPAATVFFDYSGRDSDTEAFGFIRLNDALFLSPLVGFPQETLDKSLLFS